MRSRIVFAAFALVVLVVSVIPAVSAVAGDPYASDPLGLVPFRDSVQEVYTGGTDDWEVWVCRAPNLDPIVTDPAGIVTALNAEITPYFEWLSGGVYRPVFRLGGEVRTDQDIAPDPDAPEKPFARPCEALVATAVSSSPEGVVIVTDAPLDEGYATAGEVCPEAPFGGCTGVYPANSRVVVLGAAPVLRLAPFDQPQWITVAHEIGHALNWAHSYGGLTVDPSTGLPSRYDNPMDVMSGGAQRGDPIGTVAYNRYAAGWVDPSQVVVHAGGVGVYELSADPASGTQMVVIPSSDPGRFFTLDARRRTLYDDALPRSGVELYQVDQRRDIACVLPSGWPETWPCFATFVRIAQVPAGVGLDQTGHVLGIDDTFDLEGFTVSVIAASTTGFTVRVAERDSGRFVDDDGNLHEANIEKIAAAGITAGCNPPDNDRYCPFDPVTRAQMAVFLLASLGLEPAPDYRGYFTDVPPDAWYTPYVERLFEVGVTSGFDDGTYRPDRPVLRRDMAVFLHAAFDGSPLEAPFGVFDDVAVTAWYAPYVEAIYRDGLTAGCDTDPLRYCPDHLVLRDQMATFLAEALGL